MLLKIWMNSFFIIFHAHYDYSMFIDSARILELMLTFHVSCNCFRWGLVLALHNINPNTNFKVWLLKFLGTMIKSRLKNIHNLPQIPICMDI